jgi:uncharacterized repeat protein (TIGR03803 family)
MLAGCGGSQHLINALGAVPQNRAIATRPNSTNYKVVYSFGEAPDGNEPLASLINVKGMLYGTSSRGGKVKYHGMFIPDGTVFSVSTAGAEHVLHSFGLYTKRGIRPVASLINVGGTLYGTTIFGGTSGKGTVFSITPSGAEKVLHSFSDSPDGASPVASLIDVNGTLYGTTAGGGAYHGVGSGCDGGCGTVFSITTGGTEKVLYSFGGGSGGVGPRASLIDVGGALYGTTYLGGKACQRYTDGGCGTVFSVTTSGKEKVLHRFRGYPDGGFPHASLINVGGTLYGTTYGGTGNCGTVFSITTGGKEKVLHNFGGADGCRPAASLIDVGGTLYGTTQHGGKYGHGTVFALTP